MARGQAAELLSGFRLQALAVVGRRREIEVQPSYRCFDHHKPKTVAYTRVNPAGILTSTRDDDQGGTYLVRTVG